ncbi:MAG: hypothetical protein VW683_02665 [Betaproteobacteria bacterium]
MISEDEVEKAVDFLRDSATKAAKARAERIYLEEFRKSLRSIIMKEHMDATVSAQEREAMADPRYVQHLEAMKIAIQRDEDIRFMRVAAEAKIEAWRSMNANYRAMKI